MAELSAVKTVRKPKHAVGELATWELRDYREELERALGALPEHSAEHQVYRSRLTEVIGEQEARSVTTGIPAAWADEPEEQA